MLSVGQINDAYNEALGRFPTGEEVARAQQMGFDGDPGKWQLIASLSGQDPSSYIAAKQQQVIQESIINRQKEQIGDINKYLEDNPLTLDEAFLQQTRQLVKEQVISEPYFKEKLSNYLDDVETQRERAQEDTDTIISDLNRKEQTYKTTEKMNWEQARESALEGKVDMGTLETGAGQRDLNVQKSARNIGLESYLTDVEQGRERATTGLERTQEDLDLGKQRFETELEREKQLRIEQEIQQRKQEELSRKQSDFQQYYLSKTGDLSGISAYL